MQKEDLIPAQTFCELHDIEISFIESLTENGLIEVIRIEENEYLEPGQLAELEKMVQFHYELGINVEGIETITHLLEKITAMQHEIVSLKNRLRNLDPGFNP